MLDKKILILANNPLSDSNSNGRTLKNFFAPEDQERLCQMYVQGGTPDFDACTRFFCVGDRDVLKAFVKHSSAGREVFAGEITDAPIQTQKKRIAKNPFTLLARDFLWNRRGWRKEFFSWIEKNAPDVLLLQAGDSPFMYRLAVNIAKRKNLPLVIYNSEDYYFKNYDYTRSTGISHALYPLFAYKLRRAIRAAIKYATLSIYISEDLKRTYDAEFSKPSEYIYTATTVAPYDKNTVEGRFSYLGNLGVNRHLGLIKIAEALSKINENYVLDVYGKLPNEIVEKAFADCRAIRYHGLVDYATVCQVMGESTLLFHTESFEKFYRQDIRHGFSTKIADSLASGTCFVIYAPPELSCTKYLKENACACVIDNEADLETKLREVIMSPELRRTYIERGKAVVLQNHNAEKNRKRMAEIINSL